jgi:hypothetical protein
MAVVVVDAENVRRSRWPNLSQRELVRMTRAWAARDGHELVIVFDGEAPEQAADVVGSPNADDEIVRIVREISGPVWLVSSDRELRDRVGSRVERVAGGGTFLRQIR